MNTPDSHLDELLAAARACRMDTSRVEYGFETRLLARIRAERDAPSPWLLLSWRLAPLFAAITLMFGAWSLADNDPALSDLDSVIASRADQEIWTPYLMEEI